jgi:hypothetical protein
MVGGQMAKPRSKNPAGVLKAARSFPFQELGNPLFQQIERSEFVNRRILR